MNGIEEERWADVPGTNGVYEVSDFGNIRRLVTYCKDTKMKDRRSTEPSYYRYSKHLSVLGYVRVTIRMGGKGKNLPVHRLVAQAFIPIDPERLFVNHKDGNTTNNHYSNLEWVTPRENSIHCARVLGKNTGEACWKAKLNLEKVREIRGLLSLKMSQRKIAAIYGVTHSTIGLIKRGSTWF